MTNQNVMSVSLKCWFQAHGVPILRASVQKWDYDRELAVAIECIDGWSIVLRVVRQPDPLKSNFDAIVEAAEGILATWKNEHRDQEPPVLKTGNNWAQIGKAWAKWKEIDELSA